MLGLADRVCSSVFDLLPIIKRITFDHCDLQGSRTQYPILGYSVLGFQHWGMASKPIPKKSLYSPGYDRFLALLKAARMRARLTQNEAASRLGKPQSFVSKCEVGERRVDVVELAAFCEAYGTSLMRFIRAFIKSDH